MGQKGSLKDRIRVWRLNQKRRKEKQKRELQEATEKYRKEKEKQGIYINPSPKKYSFISIVFHSILGLFISFLEPQKKQYKKTQEQLCKEVIRLQQKVEQNTDAKLLQTYYQEVEEKEKTFAYIKKSSTQTTSSPIIEDISQRLKCIKETIQEKQAHSDGERKEKQSALEPQTEQQKEQNKEQVSHPQKTIKQDEQGKNLDVEAKKDSSKPIAILKPEPTVELAHPKEASESVKEEQNYYQAYLIDANKKLKKHRETIQKLKEDRKKTTDLKELYRIESDMKWIENQLYLMEQEYQQIAKEKEFQYLKNEIDFYQMDKNNLLKNSEAIQDLIKECQNMVYQVEERTKEKVVESKKKDKKEQPKEKKEEKKKKQKEYYLDIEDFKQLQSQITMDLNRQLEDIKEIELSFVTRHPKGFLGHVMHFVSNTLFLLTPMVFFKNRLAGMLTSSILVKNRIRSMQKMVSQKEAIYETGETLLSSIKNRQDCLAHIRLNLTTSLIELQEVKQNFITKYYSLYPVETESILVQLELLEQGIMEKTTLLQMDQRELKQIQQKYQKVFKK